MTPDSHTNQELYIDVGDGHRLYVHDWGNKQAKLPICNLHGGPGGGTSDSAKRWYDPQVQRVIFFDQRGAGKSTPTGELQDNTTAQLVTDIDTIANELGIERFVLRGGSWGACLALAYGLHRPERVVAMVLDGIFTGSKKEIGWLDRGRFQTFFPDVWRDFLAATPASHHADAFTYHYKRAFGSDMQAAKESAYAYACMETKVLSLGEHIHPEPFETYDPTNTLIEMHYLAHNCFMPDNHIIDQASKLNMPIYLVQGRYDMVCPPDTAFALAQAAPHAQLHLTVSGHAAERESLTAIRILLRQLTQ